MIAAVRPRAFSIDGMEIPPDSAPPGLVRPAAFPIPRAKPRATAAAAASASAPDNGAPAPASAPRARGLGGALSGPLGDIAGGLINMEPSLPPGAAFAQGFAGAIMARDARLTREATSAAAAAELEYRHGRDTTADERSAQEREDRLAEREYQHGRDETTDERQARLDEQTARTAEMNRIKTGVETENLAGRPVREGSEKVETALNTWRGRELQRLGVGPQGLSFYSLPAGQQAKYTADEAAERSRLESLYLPSNGAAAAPRVGSPAAEGGKMVGSGTENDPFRHEDGSPISETEFTKLPKGAHFAVGDHRWTR